MPKRYAYVILFSIKISSIIVSQDYLSTLFLTSAMSFFDYEFYVNDFLCFDRHSHYFVEGVEGQEID